VRPDGQPLDVVHRDVTPSNVLTTTAGEVKLVDFGVVHVGRGGVTTRAGTVRGKPAYLSPEQILGGPLDGRSDLFATGIVLHELLSLEPLFQADTELATIYRVMEHPIVPPSRLRAGVPPEVDRIVMRALERQPAARYQSALEMATGLAEFLATCPIGRPEIAALAAWFVRAARARRKVPPPDGAVTAVAQIFAPGPSQR
jgi:serine/threonine-protein kinase